MGMHVKGNFALFHEVIGELGDEVRKAVRPAAQAGAQVIYNEVKRNVAGIGRKTGNLANAIYQAFSKDNSGELFSTYHVSVNHKKAPHWHLVEYGHLMEYAAYIDARGHWRTDKSRPLATPKQVAAKPYIRPAAAKLGAALAAAEQELYERLSRTF